MEKFFKWLRCRWYGHDTVATGRNAFILYEVVCQRCHRRFVAHPRYNILLPPDDSSDRFMADCAEYERSNHDYR